MWTNVNFLAVLVAAALGFGFGGIWYSKALFGNIWMRETGVRCDDPAAMSGSSKAKMMGITFLLTLIAAYVFAVFLGTDYTLGKAICTSLCVGLGFIATALGVNYLYLQRSRTLYFIDAGYYVIQFLIFGLVLGLWH